MRRIEPAYPDLLPIQYRFGNIPPTTSGVRLDPVGMKLLWPDNREKPRRGDRSVGRRPVRVLVHAQEAVRELDYVTHLLSAGCGVVLLLDDPVEPSTFPAPRFAGQIVVIGPWLPDLWRGRPLERLAGWNEAGIPAGALLGLAPVLDPAAEVGQAVAAARSAGASFALAVPVCAPPLDRRRIVEERFGEDGNAALEDLFFHTDLGELAVGMERAASRLVLEAGLSERLPGPGTSVLGPETFAAGAALLLWARRLDILDGVASLGWQLRRAAQALIASARDVGSLLREDNLRVVPGFEPWVEAFARALWHGSGQPFDEWLARWLSV